MEMEKKGNVSFLVKAKKEPLERTPSFFASG